MEFKTLTISSPYQLFMFSLRGLLSPAKAFFFILVLSCNVFSLIACEPCTLSGIQNSAEYDACGSHHKNPHVADSSLTNRKIQSFCTNPHTFCFPSTLFGVEGNELQQPTLEIPKSLHDTKLSVGSMTDASSSLESNKNLSSDFSRLDLPDGRRISCSLNFKESNTELSSIQAGSTNQESPSLCSSPLLNHMSTSSRLNKNTDDVYKLGSSEVSSSININISPPLLDWGQKFLFFPSVAFLTVANTCNNSILDIYEPFSSNVQFSSCNFTGVSLRPGEIASICFLFLPRWLGMSSAQLIMQTSLGRVLVQAKGLAVESPYEVQPLVNMDLPFSRWLSKKVSLLNPLDETLSVQEVTTWISISLGNISYHTEASCSLEGCSNLNEVRLLSVNDWLVVKSNQVGLPLMVFTPHNNWEIGPQSRETIIELNFSMDSEPNVEAKVIGAFCVQLLRSYQNHSDTIIVPFEIDIDKKDRHENFAEIVSVSLEAMVQCDATGTVVISLENTSNDILRVIEIKEVAVSKLFHIKYVEGLLLLPESVTQVALVTCAQLPSKLHYVPPEMPSIDKNCVLLVLTNHSSRPQIEICCQDVFNTCSRNHKDSSVGINDQSKKLKSDSSWTKSLGIGMQSSSQFEALETVEADDLVLRNWKSHGTASGMSVLDDQVVLFSTVEVGTHDSKWITVRNPSQQPVVMQLILNSGEVIDECRDQDDLLQPTSSSSLVHSESPTPKRYGFSMTKSAQTEAYIHPYGHASFGPIFFHPSNRCRWRSSALIRNNLSGVEWLSLKGIGGSLSLILVEEGTDPLQSIEFNLDIPTPFNFSPFDVLFGMEDTNTACLTQLHKELYAKNTGDMPLVVKSIGISGTRCGLDGFMVHNCNSFSLQPGESTKLLISYQTGFYAAVVHRDLELSLATGIFFIPLKANIPLYMLNFCKKSMFWTLVRKFAVGVLLIASLMFLMYCCIIPQVVMPMDHQDYSYKNGRRSITSLKSLVKYSQLDCNQRANKFSVSAEMGCLSRLVGEEKISKQAFSAKSERGRAARDTTSTYENRRKYETQSGKPLSPLLPKSVVVENPEKVEVSEPENLTVRIGKEKGKRRRKRKNAGHGLNGLPEASSSQSGNSTPSSPLSVVTSITPKPAPLSPDVYPLIESRNPFARVAEGQCEKAQVSEPVSKAKILHHHVPMKHCSSNWYYSGKHEASVSGPRSSKPALLPSTTYPKGIIHSIQSSSLASPSIAPHARAPGSKLCNQKVEKAEERSGIRNDYAYDIWGDHLSGLYLSGKSNDVPTRNNSSFKENNSDSFFVRGPPIFIAKSQPRYASLFHSDG